MRRYLEVGVKTLKRELQDTDTREPLAASELKRREDIRRKFLKRSHSSAATIVLTWTGTALQTIVLSPIFWVNVGGEDETKILPNRIVSARTASYHSYTQW